ncbi:MAG: hypothetical protein WED04_09330 [Promethearchaeati archaeon SRVP18_Atabeyarchaeia-1]
MGKKSVVEKYGEMQRRRGRWRMHVARRLATITALVIGTLFIELLILGFSTDKALWQNALVWGGMLWIGIGALVGGGFADTTMVGRMNPAASPITGEALARDRLNERDKQLSAMLTMMAVGAVLLLLGIILGFVL